MALTNTWPTQDASGMPLIDMRRLVGGEWQRPGIIPISLTPIVSGRADGAYNVEPFQAVTQRTTAGMERVANDSTIVAGDTAETPPVSNSRIDVIWVRSQFTFLGDSADTPEVGVTLGTAAVTPVKPSIPAGAIELASGRRYSTDTTTSTVALTQGPFTAPMGGVMLVRNSTELNAWTPDSGVAYRLDNGILYQRSGGSWSGIQPNAHTHAAADITSGTIGYARLPVGTGSTQVAKGSHTHAAADITSGTIGYARLPVGTGSTQVSQGNHNHDSRYYTKSQVDGLLSATVVGMKISGTTDANGIVAVDNPFDPTKPSWVQVTMQHNSSEAVSKVVDPIIWDNPLQTAEVQVRFRSSATNDWLGNNTVAFFITFGLEP